MSTDGPRRLGSGEVHLWQASLTASAEELAALTAVVSAAERRRAEQFRFDVDRRHYLVGRGRLRRLLGRYLDVDPSEVSLAEAEHGKPYLAGNGAGLEFNLSHSAAVVVYAVTRDCKIGVDIESLPGELDVDGVARRVFTTAERRLLAGVPERRRKDTFITLWTRKEAVLKGLGTGFSLPPIQVEALPGRPVKVLAEGEHPHWSVGAVATRPGFRAAVAVSRPVTRLPRTAAALTDDVY